MKLQCLLLVGRGWDLREEGNETTIEKIPFRRLITRASILCRMQGHMAQL